MILLLQQQACLSLSEHSHPCLSRAGKQGTLFYSPNPLSLPGWNMQQLHHFTLVWWRILATAKWQRLLVARGSVATWFWQPGQPPASHKHRRGRRMAAHTPLFSS